MGQQHILCTKVKQFDERKRMNNKRKQIIKIVIPLIIALLSVFVFARFTTSTEYHAKTIQSLNEKKTTVMELTAASTAASAAITLIPGDTGTPIAEKLADLSSYFLVVLCALFLEKYLDDNGLCSIYDINTNCLCIIFGE